MASVLLTPKSVKVNAMLHEMHCGLHPDSYHVGIASDHNVN